MVAISSPVVKLLRAGRLGYLPALRLQKLVRSSILEEGGSPTGHTLILVEHEPGKKVIMSLFTYVKMCYHISFTFFQCILSACEKIPTPTRPPN